MQEIYQEVKTTYKYGVILQGREGELLDSPAVFRHRGRVIALATSKDLRAAETDRNDPD
jgi:hypothetical protein